MRRRRRRRPRGRRTRSRARRATERSPPRSATRRSSSTPRTTTSSTGPNPGGYRGIGGTGVSCPVGLTAGAHSERTPCLDEQSASLPRRHQEAAPDGVGPQPGQGTSEAGQVRPVRGTARAS
jgi:hypothetical protein